MRHKKTEDPLVGQFFITGQGEPGEVIARLSEGYYAVELWGEHLDIFTHQMMIDYKFRFCLDEYEQCELMKDMRAVAS